MKKKSSGRGALVSLMVVGAASVATNVYLLSRPPAPTAPPPVADRPLIPQPPPAPVVAVAPGTFTDQDRIIVNAIDAYLDRISGPFQSRVRELAQKQGRATWGCGPTTFALSTLLAKRFFDGNVPLSVQCENDPYEIIQRFGLVETGGTPALGDHSWLEVHIRDHFLIVDPTLAQYGRVNGIVHREFRMGDSDFKAVLKRDLGIIDLRLRKLVLKQEMGIPAAAPPYPDFTIDPAGAEYYKHVNKLRDEVFLGKLPDEWKPWVDALLNEFGPTNN